MRFLISTLTIIFLIGSSAIFGQTSSFTYQGKMVDGSQSANGPYDFIFRLFDADSGGAQVGTEITRDDVPVVNGIFSVLLDFGQNPFNIGAIRYLQIEVRPGVSTNGFTVLSPRQLLTSAPLSIRSTYSGSADAISASCTLCVTDGQVQSLDASKIVGTVQTASSAINSANLGGVPAAGYLRITGGTIIGDLHVGGVLSGDGSGLSNVSANFPWEVVSDTTAVMQSNRGYIVDGAEKRFLRLPTSPTVGDVVKVAAIENNGGFRIVQNSGQYIALRSSNAAPTTMVSCCGSVSSDGSKLVLRRGTNNLFTSSDFGANFVLRETARDWGGTASSADGSKLVAFAGSGQIYTSTDFGVTWTPRDSNRNWTAVASSADGTKLAATVMSGQIYISSDAGVTWTARQSNRSWK